MYCKKSIILTQLKFFVSLKTPNVNDERRKNRI